MGGRDGSIPVFLLSLWSNVGVPLWPGVRTLAPEAALGYFGLGCGKRGASSSTVGGGGLKGMVWGGGWKGRERDTPLAVIFLGGPSVLISYENLYFPFQIF